MRRLRHQSAGPDRSNNMKKGLSTHLFVDDKLTLDHLTSIRDNGFNGLEIFALRPHFDYQDRRQTAELASWIADQDGFLRSLHTPFCRDYQAKANGDWLSIGELERLKREKAVDEIRRALEFAEKVPLPLAVVHMGAPDDRFTPKHLDAIYYSLETLIPFAAARGVKIALENIPNRLSPLDCMRRFLADAALQDVGICFDSGHSHLRAPPESEIRDGGPWIVSTHLHDNDGIKDQHLLPFDGKINWPNVLEAFDSIGYSGHLVMELEARGRSAAEVLKQAGQRFDRFEKCREEMLEMKTREG